MTKTILVVEDDKYIRESLCYFIEEELGCKCMQAEGSVSAVNQLAGGGVDLVLLDFILKDETAIPILEWLKTYKGKQPKLVLMTAVSRAEVLAKQLNIPTLLKKPFSLDELEHLIRNTY